MGVIKTKGLVIAQHNLKDNDLMLTILTPEHGKIACAAKGAKRPKSNMMAATQYLCFGEYIIYKGVSSYTINSCEAIEIFYNIRLDIDKLEYATKVCKILYSVTDENQYIVDIMKLALNTLYMISESDRELDFILSVFKLRLLKELGLKPILDKCTICGKQENLQYFNLRTHGMICDNCKNGELSKITISPNIYKAINYIYASELNKIFSFIVSEDGLQELKLIANQYFNVALDREYK